MKERVELCCGFSSHGKPKNKGLAVAMETRMHLVNANLLAHVLIEWTLWQSLQEVSGLNLWQLIFRVLDCLLENNPSAQLFHSNVFIRFNLIEKLMHFLLDANEEQFVFEENSCNSLINIFKVR